MTAAAKPKIRKAPIPNYRAGAKWVATLEAMKSGDVVTVETRYKANALYIAGKRRGIAVLTRLREDGKVDVWRTE